MTPSVSPLLSQKLSVTQPLLSLFVVFSKKYSTGPEGSKATVATIPIVPDTTAVGAISKVGGFGAGGETSS
ncbi:hypothetical protein Hhel01_04303 [Haloferula helveola]